VPTLQAHLTDEMIRRGANVFFGVPGDFIIKYFNYLENRPDVTLVRMNDEAHAGSAADAFARIKGFGVVVATYAVGGFKLVNGLAQAYVESSPVLLVSGAPARRECQESSSILSYRVHHLVKDPQSQRRVFAEVTGRQEVIDNLYTARSQIAGLLDYITSMRRPGYIEIGRDLLDEKLPRHSIATNHFVHPPRVSDARALQEAVERTGIFGVGGCTSRSKRSSVRTWKLMFGRNSIWTNGVDRPSRKSFARPAVRCSRPNRWSP